MRVHGTKWLSLSVALTTAITEAAAADAAQDPSPSLAQYKFGQGIPVTCLNRTIETGEHITDAKGQLQYVPFATCNETGRPLELYFGVEKDINCTIDFVDDPFFHLLEFYVHNDAPLTCRIPSRPFSSQTQPSSTTTTTTEPIYIPLIIALTGVLELSHLHISTNLNALLHAAPRSLSPGVVSAATAYSISGSTRVVIGDPLPLRFAVRWYPNTSLPSGWTGVGGHLFLSTVVYCVLSAIAATAVCVAYFRGVELPKRLRSHGRDRASTLGGAGGGGGGGAIGGRYGYVGNGYGYGVSSGNGQGKVD